jgi:HSP20 family protein
MNGENREKKDRVYDRGIRIYDPFDAVDKFMHSALSLRPDKFFDFPTNDGFKLPESDIIDNGNSFEVKIDLPGVDKKDIDLKVKNDHIIIKAEKTEEKENKEKKYYSKERTSVGYYNEIPLPEEVKSDSAKAKYENGTLTINVDKSDRAKENSVKIE